MILLSDWRENGIVLTAVAVLGAALVAVAEQRVAQRAQAPLVIAVTAAVDADDDGDEDVALAPGATVPLYASLAELETRARAALADDASGVELLYELARQARGFRAWALADALLARCIDVAPGNVEALFLRARTQSDLGQAAAAAQLYERVLAAAPHHQKATYNLGVLSRRAGDLARAETLLARASSIASGRVKAKALHQLALVHAARGRWDESARLLRDAVALRPDAPRYWLDLGRAEEGLGRIDPALAAYDKALALNRRFDEAHAALGLLQEKRGNHATALSHLARAVRADATNPGYRKALARLQLADGNVREARAGFAWLAQSGAHEADRAYAEAMLALLDRDAARMVAHVKRAEALAPGANDDGLERAAIALHEQKDYAGAQALLDLLLARPAPSPEVLLAAARTASRLERWADAAAYARRSAAARPDSSEAWFVLGRALSELGDVAGAIGAYRSSLERNPDARNTRLNLAVLYSRSGRDAEALVLYGELLRAYPRYAPALINRALLHERAGRVPDAIADFEAARAAAPDNADIPLRLAALLLRSGQTQRATALLDEAVAALPADPAIRLLLAEAQLQAGERERALKELGRAAALVGDDAALWNRLAVLYRAAGDDPAAARAQAQAARRSAPSKPESASPPPKGNSP